MSLSLDDVREAAVSKAICPISLEDLRLKPDQVGAFVYKGQRVEPALYHKDSLWREDGSAIFSGNLTPVGQQQFDGFEKMPRLPKQGAAMDEWEDFVEFFHWNKKDDWLLVAEVAIAFAAAISVDEDGVERFIRCHFDVDCDGHIQRAEMEEQIVPYLSNHLDELQATAPCLEVPRLFRTSTRADVIRWFEFWDFDRSGEVDLIEFRFAVAMTLYQALGYSVDAQAKEAVVLLFLSEVTPEETSQISRSTFLDIIYPALQANLPELPNLDTKKHRRSSMPPIRLIVENTETGKNVDIEILGGGTVEDLVKSVQKKFGGAQELFFDGFRLDDMEMSIGSVRGVSGDAISNGCHIKASPAQSMCVIC